MASINLITSKLPSQPAVSPKESPKRHQFRPMPPKVLPELQKMKKGGIKCRGEEKAGAKGKVVRSMVSAAAAMAAAGAGPAVGLVDERMSTEGTGLPFGLSNNLLGWILFGVFGLVWALYFIYASSLDEDEDSGLSL